jgi:hypothetical protein
MELKRIEQLLEKYFEAETSIAEEKELKAYFISPNVAPHLEQYKSMFGYFSNEATREFYKTVPLKNKRSVGKWMSVAASVVLMAGMFTYLNNEPAEQDLGTYESPEQAFLETQKALNMISKNVNVGVKSINCIGQYEEARQTIFKE